MMHSVIMELRPRLRVCNVFMLTEENFESEDSIKISVKPVSFSVSCIIGSKEIVQNITWTGCRIVPGSLSALKVQQKSITFRVQTEPNSQITGSFFVEVLPHEKFEDKYDDNSEIPVNISPCTPCFISCKCCKNCVSKGEITFQRVLPLPSSSWEHTDWFCHQHSQPNVTNILDDVKETDCLYSSCFILINSSLLNLPPEKVLRCKRCLTWLGTSKGSASKLWQCAVFSGEDKLQKSALDNFKLLIESAIKDTPGAMCRIVLESQISKEKCEYILIWVMDKEIHLLVNTNKNSGVCSVDNDVSNIKAELILNPVKTVKLLYLHQETYNTLVQTWKQDLNVQTIDVAKQMFVDGLQHLINITEFIPAPYHIASNFLVAYLGF